VPEHPTGPGNIFGAPLVLSRLRLTPTADTTQVPLAIGKGPSIRVNRGQAIPSGEPDTPLPNARSENSLTGQDGFTSLRED
jgi:hypothetical protein